jgi:hypothetical protein
MKPASLAPLLAFACVLAPSIALADPPTPDAIRHATRYLDRSVVASAVRLAILHTGLQPERTREIATRARAGGLLPNISVRVMRGLNASTAQTAAVPYGDRFASDDSLVIDVRAQFDFDRLVFDPHEVTLERIEVTRTERRDVLEREVVDQLATLARADLVLSTAAPGTNEWIEAQIVTARARARIEALTGATLPALVSSR